jgi:hypothetical protein
LTSVIVSSAAFARRSTAVRIGAGAVGPDGEAPAVDATHRAAAGATVWIASIGVRTRTPGDLGLVAALEAAGEARDIRRRPAHVEADHLLEAPAPAPPRRSQPRHPRAPRAPRRGRETCRGASGRRSTA